MRKYIPKKYYSKLQKIKQIVVIILYKIFSKLKVKDFVVMYSPSKNKLEGNLLYIYEQITNKEVYLFFKNINKIKFIYMIARAKTIIVDDYVPILYILKFRKESKFIQIWHASGMFKKVGFARLGSTGGPNENSLTHKNYTDVIISSTNLINEYSNSFRVDEKIIKPLGTPRTDLFFNKEKIQKLENKFFEKYPICKNKRILLYAPTFRGNGLKSAYIDLELLNINKLIDSLPNNYILLVKKHPFCKNNFKINSEHIIDISDITEINNILSVVDILITDYSSSIFDALLLNKNVIFYVPDLEKYQSNRGSYYNLEEYNYGVITKDIDSLIKAIKKPVFNKKKAEEIKKKHLNMCDGNSTKRFIDTYLQ